MWRRHPLRDAHPQALEARGERGVREAVRQVPPEHEPNQTFFDEWYYGDDAERGRALYCSACLDALDGSGDIDNETYCEFMCSEQMLFNVQTDKIEACNKADAGDPYEHKREELMSYLEQRAESMQPNIAVYNERLMMHKLSQGGRGHPVRRAAQRLLHLALGKCECGLLTFKRWWMRQMLTDSCTNE